MDRFARLLSASTRSSRILEIGASYNPVAPKAKGWRTSVIDHASQQDLRAKYSELGVDVTAIEEVDFIWRDGPLHEAVPAELHGTFDTLIASHTVEHVPDIAGFLISAARLLRPDGVVSLALPDRRYCFDYFKPITTTGDVLEAHASGRSRHSLRSVWNHHAYAINMDGIGAWGQAPVHRITPMGGFQEAKTVLAGFSDARERPYVDCHAWILTPASFELVMLELNGLGILDWHIDTLHGPEGCEFFAILRRGTQVPATAEAFEAQRTRLLQRQLLEIRDQINWALAGGALLDGAASDQGAGHIAWSGGAHPGTDGPGQLAGLTATVQSLGVRVAALERVVGRVVSILRPFRPLARLFGLAPRGR